MLEQPVTHGYFARADKINDLHLKDYSESSLNFYEIYDRVIMPPMSKEKLIEKLSDAWDQQILRKAKKIEFFAIKKTAP